MKKVNTILAVSILIAFALLGIVLPYRDGNSLWTVLSILWLFVEPTKILYRRTYKRISSMGYQVLLLCSEFVIIGFIIYQKELSFWVIYSILLLLLFLSFFTKKESYTRNVDISKLLLGIIAIISFSTYFNEIGLGLIQVPIAMSLSIFSFLLMFCINKVTEQKNLRFIYLILMLFAIISRQPVCFILLIRLFLDLDYF